MIRQHKKMILLTSIADTAPDPYRIAFVEAASGFRCNPLEHRQRTGRLLIQGFCSVRAFR